MMDIAYVYDNVNVDVRDNISIVGADDLGDVSFNINGIHVDIETDISGDISLDVKRDIRVDHMRHCHLQDDTFFVH